MEEGSKVKKDSKLFIFILIGVVGLILLIFGGSITNKTAGGDKKEETLPDSQVYAKGVEEEIERICASVAGNCGIEVVVSLEGGYRAVYASDSQSTSSGYKNSMVLIGSGSSEEAVLVCYENPKISGIGIVLSCREDKNLRNNIISLVSAAFSVGTNKIYVAFRS